MARFLILSELPMREKVKNSSLKKLSADCWPTVGRQLANSRTTVSQQLANSRTTVDRESANCWPIVGRLSFTIDFIIYEMHYRAISYINLPKTYDDAICGTSCD